MERREGSSPNSNGGITPNTHPHQCLDTIGCSKIQLNYDTLYLKTVSGHTSCGLNPTDYVPPLQTLLTASGGHLCF